MQNVFPLKKMNNNGNHTVVKRENEGEDMENKENGANAKTRTSESEKGPLVTETILNDLAKEANGKQPAMTKEAKKNWRKMRRDFTTSILEEMKRMYEAIEERMTKKFNELQKLAGLDESSSDESKHLIDGSASSKGAKSTSRSAATSRDNELNRSEEEISDVETVINKGKTLEANLAANANIKIISAKKKALSMVQEEQSKRDCDQECNRKRDRKCRDCHQERKCKQDRKCRDCHQECNRKRDRKCRDCDRNSEHECNCDQHDREWEQNCKSNRSQCCKSDCDSKRNCEQTRASYHSQHRESDRDSKCSCKCNRKRTRESYCESNRDSECNSKRRCVLKQPFGHGMIKEQMIAGEQQAREVRQQEESGDAMATRANIKIGGKGGYLPVEYNQGCFPMAAYPPADQLTAVVNKMSSGVGKVTCFRCGINGHTRDICTLETWKCYNCHKMTKDHWSHNCPLRKEGITEPPRRQNSHQVTKSQPQSPAAARGARTRSLGLSQGEGSSASGLEWQKTMRRISFHQAQRIQQIRNRKGKAKLMYVEDYETVDEPDDLAMVYICESDYEDEEDPANYANIE